MNKKQQKSLPILNKDFLKKFLEKESNNLSKGYSRVLEVSDVTNNYDTFCV